MNKAAKFDIGDSVMIYNAYSELRGPYTVRWVATFYKCAKYWLEELPGCVFDERQLEVIDDTE